MSCDGEAAVISAGEGARRGPRLPEQIRGRLRVNRHSLRAEQACLYWIRRYIRDHLPRYPDELDGVTVEAFLTHLATRDYVVSQLYTHALQRDVGGALSPPDC